MLLARKNIFIVEDDIFNRVVYRMSLGIQGKAHVEFDMWGRDTTFKLQQGTWDLIILDLMLGRDASGFQVFKEIRQLHEFDSIPIIAISASEPSVSIPKAREMGFNGFISKPVKEDMIVKQVAQVIAGESIWYDGTLRA
jgi:CheY-like chemotaxis protein